MQKNMLRANKKFTILTIIISYACIREISSINFTNLICKGDFEYGLKQFPNKQNYQYLASDYSCWYDLAGGAIEIKTYPTSYVPVITGVCDMVSTVPYILCQNVALQINKEYQLNFSIFNPSNMAFSTFKFLMNNSSVYNYSIANPIKKSNTSYRFIANQTNNSLCFDFTADPNAASSLSGPFLDNVTLVKLSPDSDKYSLNCSTNIDSITGEINILCNYQESAEVEYYLNLFKAYLKVYISENQQNSYVISKLNSTCLMISIQPGQEYSLKKIVVSIEGEDAVGVPVPKFQFEVEGLNVYVVNMSENEKTTIKEIYSFSQQIMSWTEKIYEILKTTFASYFLINIINFWNLSLMYNVLNISTIPAFSKNFLEKLTFLFFNLNSLIEWSQENIPNMKGGFNFTQIDGREFLEEKKYGFAWFGAFGLSSNFVVNNLETFFLIFLMMIKIGFILLLRRVHFIRKHLKHVIEKKRKLLKIFLLQIISLEAFMIMSATESLLNLNFLSVKQKINAFIQVINIWFCLIVVVLYLIVSIKLYTKVLPSLKKNSKLTLQKPNPSFLESCRKVSKRNKKVILTQFNNIFEFIPILMVPSLILFENSLIFLIATSVTVLFRLYWYCKHAKKFILKLDDKIFNGFNIFFWLILQVCYLLLWYFQKILENDKDLDKSVVSRITSSIKIIGFVIVFTVLIGGMFEILRFIVQVLKEVAKFIRYVFRKCKELRPKENKIMPFTYKHNKNKRQLFQKNNGKLVTFGLDLVAKGLRLREAGQDKKVSLVGNQIGKKIKKTQSRGHEMYRLHVIHAHKDK